MAPLGQWERSLALHRVELALGRPEAAKVRLVGSVVVALAAGLAARAGPVMTEPGAWLLAELTALALPSGRFVGPGLLGQRPEPGWR